MVIKTSSHISVGGNPPKMFPPRRPGAEAGRAAFGTAVPRAALRDNPAGPSAAPPVLATRFLECNRNGLKRTSSRASFHATGSRPVAAGPPEAPTAFLAPLWKGGSGRSQPSPPRTLHAALRVTRLPSVPMTIRECLQSPLTFQRSLQLTLLNLPKASLLYCFDVPANNYCQFIIYVVSRFNKKSSCWNVKKLTNFIWPNRTEF